MTLAEEYRDDICCYHSTISATISLVNRQPHVDVDARVRSCTHLYLQIDSKVFLALHLELLIGKWLCTHFQMSKRF